MSDENNIFYFHQDARLCAEWLHDKHTVKMHGEVKRLLSNAVQLQYAERIDVLQRPCIFQPDWLAWTIGSIEHISWVYSLYNCLSKKLENVFSRKDRDWRFNMAIEQSIPRFQRVDWTNPPLVVPEDCVMDDVTAGYRKFYLRCKVKVGSYKRVKMPYWVRDAYNEYQPDGENGLDSDGFDDIMDS